MVACTGEALDCIIGNLWQPYNCLRSLVKREVQPDLLSRLVESSAYHRLVTVLDGLGLEVQLVLLHIRWNVFRPLHLNEQAVVSAPSHHQHKVSCPG